MGPSTCCDVCDTCVVSQAAPNVAAFSKGAVAGARLFAVMNRKPDIEIGEARCNSAKGLAALAPLVARKGTSVATAAVDHTIQ